MYIKSKAEIPTVRPKVIADFNIVRHDLDITDLGRLLKHRTPSLRCYMSASVLMKRAPCREQLTSRLDLRSQDKTLVTLGSQSRIRIRYNRAESLQKQDLLCLFKLLAVL